MSEGIEASVWVKRGSMLIRRECLDIDDTESWLSLWINKYGSLTDFPFDELGITLEGTNLSKILKKIPTESLKLELMFRRDSDGF